MTIGSSPDEKIAIALKKFHAEQKRRERADILIFTGYSVIVFVLGLLIGGLR